MTPRFLGRAFHRVSLAYLLGSTLLAAPASAQPAGFDMQAFQTQVTSMNASIGAGRRSANDVIADARRLGGGFQSMRPAASRFTGADRALNQRIATQSFQWLSSAWAMHRGNPAVQAQLMDTYGTIGAFYRDAGALYPAGAFAGYGGACQLARLLVLTGASGDAFERDLQNYALAYATAAYTYGKVFDAWVAPLTNGSGKPPSVQAPPVPVPLKLPAVDESSLTAAQREQWQDVQDRFRSTSPRVHEARIRMNELATRLTQQRMMINVTDAATASKMQGFLEDAVALVEARQFDQASQALVRAAYERNKLRNVIGQ